ncbi:MAG: stage II sporulation protein P [Christensenellales bacterium]|jgi:stage II sporulation protein P
MRRKRKKSWTESLFYYAVCGGLSALLILSVLSTGLAWAQAGGFAGWRVQGATVSAGEDGELVATYSGGGGFLADLLGIVFNPMGIISSEFPSVKAVEVPEVMVAANMETDEQASPEIQIKINNMKKQQPEQVAQAQLKTGEPTILIYHTHTTEAYTKTTENYQETTAQRSEDNGHNIVSIGADLARYLTAQYGFSVLHDTTNHEPPRLGTAYERSLTTMEKYRDEHSSMKVYIDLHRDAYIADSSAPQTVEIDGKQVATVLFVVGTGEGHNGTPFSIVPDWEANFKLANQVTEKLNEKHPNLAKAVRVSKGRYNQHISNMCMLIEIGNNANTTQEARNAIPYVAEALDAVLSP